MWAQSLGDSGLSGPISSALVIVVESGEWHVQCFVARAEMLKKNLAGVYMAWLIAMTVLRLKATPWFFCMFSIVSCYHPRIFTT